MRASRIVALVLGCLLLIPAIALLFGGGALGLGYAFGRGDDGYFDVTLDRLTTDTVAITAEDLAFASEPGSPDWVLDALDADIRIRATGAESGREIFVGIAREVDVDAYLDGVAHDEVSDVEHGSEPVYRRRTGSDAIAPPTEQQFWSASTAGPGTQELRWEATSGRWAAVVMNADGDPGVSVDVNIGAKAGIVLPLAWTMLGLGAVVMVLAVVLIVVGARPVRSNGEAPPPTTHEGHATPYPDRPGGNHPNERHPDEGGTAESGRTAHPVALTARLDPDLSRWRWLVKWFLAIPHFVVLVFLWIAFVVLTLVAAVAIVVTGRYPRGIFDFNVGVLRWSWRVGFYASTGGIGTDRYPPFSLQPEPGDAARLDVVYPDSLSRGLVFVKWLLAIPHLVIIALLVGSSVRWLGTGGERIAVDPVGGGGLLGILVLVAGVALLFTGRYPKPLFDLIVGLNRWIYRTVAYVALMTDTYPPFRLDQGDREPGSEPGAPLPPPLDVRPAAGPVPTVGTSSTDTSS